MEQHGLVAEHHHLLPQPRRIEVAHVVAVQKDAACIGGVQPDQEIDQRGLADPARPEDRHPLTGRHPKAQPA